MTKEAGDYDLGYVRRVGAAAAHTHHSEYKDLKECFVRGFRRSVKFEVWRSKADKKKRKRKWKWI